MSATRRLVAAAIVAAAVVSAPPADAQELSRAGLADLARRAKTDPAALTQLREVDSVDGRAVDIARALDGARGSELAGRLDAIADDAASGRVASSGDARSDAADILSERRFQPSELPRPFAGPLRRLGDVLGRAYDRVVAALPGGQATFWVICSLLAAALGAFVASRLARRRRDSGARPRTAPGERPETADPRTLLAEADRAEAAGDGRTAVRLRFRAGLLRLSSLGAIVFRPSITTGEVLRDLRSRDFEVVARSFEEIAYGDRPVTEADLDVSRSGWDAVIGRVAA